MSSIDWNLIQDFDSVERDHSQPRWEYAIIDAGETVALKETTPMGKNVQIHYIPVSVLCSIDALTEQSDTNS